ncbi:GRIP domain-containing protein [Aphelenchoides fujianensis]|nr:GRIP domain-containing protein [Aphelenchoides fujianensis]
MREDSDQKNELNRFVKSNEQLQRRFDELQAEFAAYKEKAEFVLRQNEEERKEKSRDQNFELVELNRQLKLKSEHISQLTDRLSSSQGETESLRERCRLLRSELEDARQSTAALQREARDERKQLQAEHEQKDAANAADRKAQDEAIARRQAEFDVQLQELRAQLARLQTSQREDAVGHEQKVPPSPKKKTSMAAVRPLNFDVESHFSAHDLDDLPTGKPDGNEMIASLSELLNGEDVEEEGRRLGTSMSSLHSWVEPEQLEAQLKHTRAILHEVEENNTKLEAQNRLLKEEIRKAERDHKSAEHIGGNMQYFKSVMLAFLKPEKINDTRLQLLPVLSTMLSFSPEEKKAVEQALQQQQKEREAAANQSAEWAGAGYLGALSGIF